MRKLIVGLMIVATCESASAAGVFNCRSDKGEATITVDAVFGYGKDSPLSSIKTKVSVNSPRVAPALRSSTMWVGSVKSYRMGRDRLDLTLGQSNKAGALDLTISTRETNGAARGSYTLTLKGADAPVMFKGAITCDIE